MDLLRVYVIYGFPLDGYLIFINIFENLNFAEILEKTLRQPTSTNQLHYFKMLIVRKQMIGLSSYFKFHLFVNS